MVDTKTDSLKFPESVTIDGVTHMLKDTPELMELVSVASRIEKSKLYTQIQGLKDGIDQLKTVQIIPAPVAEPNGATLKAEILGSVKAILEESLKPIKDNIAKQALDTVEGYTAKLLADNEGKCIPELVTGTTKEEINESLKNSIALRSKYVSGNVPHTEGHVTDPALVKQAAEMGYSPSGVQPQRPIEAIKIEGSTVKPTSIPTPAITIPSTEIQPATVPNIKGMSQDEFSRRRAELAAQLESTLQTQ